MIKEVARKLIRATGWDLHRFNASSSSEMQLLAAINHARINTIFDIGANTGQFSVGLRSSGFTGDIISFEPLTSAREKLLNHAGNDNNWTVHDQCAIGDQDGVIEINIAGNSVSSSVLPMLEMHAVAAVGSSGNL